MSFNQKQFVWPSSADALQAEVEPVFISGDSEISQAITRLNDLPAIDFKKNAVSSSAINASATTNNLYSLLDVDASFLIVHPFQYGSGDGEKSPLFLSAPNAVSLIADKLNDRQDFNLPSGNLDALTLLISDRTLKGFSDKLISFCSVFPIAELETVSRTAKQLLDLENTKLVLPDAPLSGRFMPRNQRQVLSVADINEKLLSSVCVLDGYDAENITPLEELVLLAEKKQAYLNNTEQDYLQLKSSFVGESCEAFFSSGNRSAVASSLRSSTTSGHAHIYSAAVLITSVEGGLTVLREIFES
ncbi:MAG: hypothetical protein K6L75_02555 [Cellvibrionaceae bacterium]